MQNNFTKIFTHRFLGAGRPATGRPALAVRLQGDQLSHHELPSAQAVRDGVAGGQPHHEATARELGDLQIHM